jgi:hypothetical protein
MPRPFAILAGLAGLSLTAGCADIMQQSAVSQIAPEWFAEKAVEVKGAGYPQLGDIPEVRPFTGTLREWTAQADTLKSDAETLEAKNTTREDFRTPEEIRATAAQWRALAEGSSSPPPPEKQGQ